MKPIFKNVSDFVRWHDWYDSKGAAFALIVYLTIIFRDITNFSVLLFLAALLHVCAYMSFGYAVNDYADRMIDRQVGKVRKFDTLPDQMMRLACWGLIVLAVFPLLSFFTDHMETVFLGIFNIALAAAYSLRPLRLKEHRLLGILVGGAIQRPLPAAIVAVACGAGWEILPWFLLFWLYGIRTMLVHQILDFKNDQQSITSTFVTFHGYDTSRRLLFIIFTFEVITLVYCFIPLLVLNIFKIFLFIYIIYSWFIWCSGRNRNMISYTEAPLVDLYQFFLPFISTLTLASANTQYLWLPVLEILWKARYIRNHFLKYAWKSGVKA